MRLGTTEVRFYREVAPAIPIALPHPYHGHVAGPGQRFVLVLEDLVPRAARFTDVAGALTVDDARRVVATLARLHAAFWQSPRLATDLAWLGPARRDRARYRLERLLSALALPAAVRRHPDLVPAAVRAAVPRIVAARDRLEARWAEPPVTVIHGDAHAGNLFFLGEEVGLLDWQVVQAGQGMRDVSYFLVTSLPTALRRAHERTLIETYLTALRTHGATPPEPEVAWAQYRLHAV